MRVFSGCLGALVGVVIGLMCASVYASKVNDGNLVGEGFTMMGLTVLVVPLGAVLGVALGLRALRYLQSEGASGATRGRKAVRLVGLAVGVAAAVGGLDWAKRRLTGPPSDDVMLAQFHRHQATLARVAQMAHADKGLNRVDCDWTDPPQPQKGSVSSARLALYRQLLDGAGVHRGFQTGDAPGEIEFLYWLRGSAITSDTDKGFAYLPKPPAHTLATLDGCGRDEKNGVQAYRHITGHWYLYYDYLPG